MNKFVYFYSPIYTFYHDHINQNLKDSFDVEPILIDDLNNKGGHTFWGGVSIKIELIIKKIEENMNNFMIFSDATIFINSKTASQLSEFIDTYKTNDLCFADNGGSSQYNIGFILIKCSDKTLSFFKNVLHELTSNKGWDQDVVNKHLQNNNELIVNVFDKQKIICGWTFNDINKDTFLIYKSFISHSSDKIKNYNMRLDIFKKAGLITNEEYDKNKK